MPKNGLDIKVSSKENVALYFSSKESNPNPAVFDLMVKNDESLHLKGSEAGKDGVFFLGVLGLSKSDDIRF